MTGKAKASAKEVKTATKAPKTVKARTLKQVKPAVKVCASIDENLKKLAKSTIPMNFVKKHNGVWNHQDWVDFLAEIAAKGYEPIDADRVGLILEDRKTRFFANSK